MRDRARSIFHPLPTHPPSASGAAIESARRAHTAALGASVRVLRRNRLGGRLHRQPWHLVIPEHGRRGQQPGQPHRRLLPRHRQMHRYRRLDGYTPTLPAAAGRGAVLVQDNYTFTALSCASTTYCLAADNDGNVYTYSGRRWIDTKEMGDGSDLTGVSCPTATFCAVTSSGATAYIDNRGTWSARNWPARTATRPTSPRSPVRPLASAPLSATGTATGTPSVPGRRASSCRTTTHSRPCPARRSTSARRWTTTATSTPSRRSDPPCRSESAIRVHSGGRGGG
jgi:hypothetical protein